MPKHKDLTGTDLHDPKTHASSHEDGGADAITNLEQLVSQVEIKMSDPYVRLIGTEASAIDVRLIETAGLLKMQNNTGSESTPSWSDVITIDASGNITGVASFDELESITLERATPFLRMIGTEGSAQDIRIAEDAGKIKFQENTNTKVSPTWNTVVTIDAVTGAFESPLLTTPQINDTSADHQYIFAVSELTADRTVTLPLLTGNDEFVFKDHAVTLTNKTVNLANNTLTGTLAEFNTAVSDATLVSLTGSETLTNKTLTDPTITLNDNTNLTFGTGSDATIDYDGTDLVVDPQVVGSGNLKLNAGGLAFGADVVLSRGAANRLDLASGDSLNLVSGGYQIAGSTVIDSGENADFGGTLTSSGDNFFVDTAGNTAFGTTTTGSVGSGMINVRVYGTVTNKTGSIELLSSDASYQGWIYGWTDGIRFETPDTLPIIFGVGGSQRFQINDGGHIGIASARRFHLDSLDASGDTYITESTANRISLVPAGDTDAFLLQNDGAVMGSATGTFQGQGTLNAKGLYDDGSLVADWTFDLYFDGRSDDEIPAWGGTLYSLPETTAMVADQRSLPWMPSRAEWNAKRSSIGEVATRLWFGQEQQQIYIQEQASVVQDLMARVADLEAQA